MSRNRDLVTDVLINSHHSKLTLKYSCVPLRNQNLKQILISVFKEAVVCLGTLS